LWDEDQITWYLDGKVCRQIKNMYNHQAINLCFDVETCPTWMGLPTKESLPAIYQVDYVRAWQAVGAPATQPSSK
jgi:beta-glucanase (GH16 family)